MGLAALLLLSAGSTVASPYVPGAHPLRATLTAITKRLTLEDSVRNVLELVAGDTAGAITLTLSNADGVQDLTGADVAIQLRERATGVLVTIDSGLVIADPETGEVEIPGTARATLGAGTYDMRAIVDGDERDIFPSTRDAAVAAPPVLVISPAWG